MAEKAGDLSASLSLSRNSEWFIVQVEIENKYVLDMTAMIQGQRIPNFNVTVRPALSRLLKVDGILGYDFFQQYIEVRFDPAARILTLVDP